MIKTFYFPVDDKIYENVTNTIHDTLTKRERDRKNILQIMLSAEEVLGKMLENGPGEGGEVKLVITRTLGSIRVILSCGGEAFDLVSNKDIGWDDPGDEIGEKSQSAIREILVNSFSSNLSYRHRSNKNTVTIKGKENDYTMMYVTLICLAAGIAVGFLMKFLFGEAFSDGFQEYFLEPVRTMFINALKILVGPVIFFSMVCCVSNFARLSDIGKIGVKILLLYLLTTAIAVCLGFLLYHAFPVGDPALLENSGGALEMTLDAEELAEMTEAVEVADGGGSFIDMIVNIIPDNFFGSFVSGNLLQILFLGIFLGAGVSVLHDKHPGFRSFFVKMNDLFMTLLDILCKVIPLAVFCNMACLVYTTGTEVLLSILSYILLCAGAIVCMLIVYHILILLLARINPFVFTKHFFKASLTALTLSSSTAAMPVSMAACRQMGISNKIVSFSIPLGSTINMDGSSLVMSIICLFMAKIYGIEITPALLGTILVSILLLSLGAPSMAGADLAVIVVLLGQIGIPASAIALVMGVDTLLDMMQAMCNTTSDGAVALIVAKQSKELDMSMYV